MVSPFLFKLDQIFGNTYLYNMGLGQVLQEWKIVVRLSYLKAGTLTSMDFLKQLLHVQLLSLPHLFLHCYIVYIGDMTVISVSELCTSASKRRKADS